MVVLAVLTMIGTSVQGANACWEGELQEDHAGQPETADRRLHVNANWPSTIPDIVRQRIRMVEAALEQSPTPGQLPAEAVVELSDDTLVVNENGELDLEFQSAVPLGQSQMDDLAALGAVVLATTSASPPPGAPPRPGPYMMVARISYRQVKAAGALPWVVAVRPVGKATPDISVTD
jgi:hypothetical protein